MKPAYTILIALLLLPLAGCASANNPAKKGSMVVQAFVDSNANGQLDAEDEKVAGVQVAYGRYGSQSTDASGTASFYVTQESRTDCDDLNTNKPFTVLVPQGYTLRATTVTPWNCEMTWNDSFRVDQEDASAFLLLEKEAAVPSPTPTQAAATLTPIPTPLPQPTQVPPGSPMPALTIEANTIPPTFGRTGLTIKFLYRITNTGNVTLTGPFTLKDVGSDLSTIICTQYLASAVLEPGAFMDCGGNRKSRLADIDAGVVGNVITISVTYVDPLTNSNYSVSAEAQTGSVYIKP
jgi:hypothetical protein